MEGKRENWIDSLKGLGMIFVVLGHVHPEGHLTSWIYSFHMPLFFALSGYVYSLSDRKMLFRDFALKKTRTILWPFIFFRLCLVLYWRIVEYRFRSLDLGPIWFLLVLYLASLSAFFLLKKNSIIRNYVMIILVASLMIVADLLKIDVWLNTGGWILRYLGALLWYIIGYDIHLTLKSIKTPSVCCWLEMNYMIVIILGIIISIIISLINPNVSMFSGDYGNYILFLIGGLVGIITCAVFCQQMGIIGDNALFRYVGRYSLIVLATHEPLKRIILKISEVLFARMRYNFTIEFLQKNIVSSLLITVIILILQYPIIELLKYIKLKNRAMKVILSFIR